MTLNFSAKITIDAKDKTKAIFDSVNTEIKFNEKLIISVESNHLAHLRANLNSTLRLIQASHDTIESVKE